MKSAPCQAAQFHAKDDWKSLTSPYYPDTIHAKTQCEWEIKVSSTLKPIQKINKVYLGTKRTESENQFRRFTIIESSNQWKMYHSGNRLRVKIFCLFYDTEHELNEVITDALAN